MKVLQKENTQQIYCIEKPLLFIYECVNEASFKCNMVHYVMSEKSVFFLTNGINKIGRLKYLYYIPLSFFFCCCMNCVNEGLTRDFGEYEIRIPIVTILARFEQSEYEINVVRNKRTWK